MRFYGINELSRPLSKESKRAIHFAVLDALRLNDKARLSHERMSMSMSMSMQWLFLR